MLETFLSVMLVGLFFLIAWATQASAETLLFGGLSVAAVGFGYGIPTAIIYHWRLYRSLISCDRLPARWWLQPTSLHDQIPADDRMGVFFWGAIGGSGFVVVLVGIILTSMGLWRTLSA